MSLNMKACLVGGRRWFLGLAAAGMMLEAGSTGWAADAEPITKAAVTTPAAEKPATEKPAAGAMTNDRLKEMFTNLGFEPNDDQITDGKLVAFYVDWKVGTFNYSVRVAMTLDGKAVALQAGLKYLPKDTENYGKELAAVLERGWYVLPSAFVADPDFHQIYLVRMIPAETVTPVLLRKQTMELAEQTRATEKYWRCDWWSKNREEALKAAANPSSAATAHNGPGAQ